jgi:pyruvate,water dikinase
MTYSILPLDSHNVSPALAGGKGASVAWLIGCGFRVPPGFIITTAAFAEFMRMAGSSPTREGLLRTPLPEPLARAITQAYSQRGGRVAVRSSLVGEDSAEASFAGQLDTFVNVEGEAAVLAAVRACWASAFSERVVRYRAEHAAPESVSMAVVVQRMVAAQVAGVGFSADPLTGAEVVVLEAARGLGEAVVSGRVTPDRWVIDPHGAILQASNPQSSVLSSSLLTHVVALVRAVAAKAKAPQDVEWAWDGETLFVLQARPITTLAADMYSSKFVSEMVPGLIKPLVWTTTTSAISRNVFARVFDDLLGPGVVDTRTLVKRIGSRIFANLTLLGEACTRLGLPANFFEAITRGERAEGRRALLAPKNLRAKLRLAGWAFRHARAERGIRAFIARHKHALQPLRDTDWSGQSAANLLDAIDALTRLHGEAQWWIFITALNMSVRNRLLMRLAQRAAPEVNVNDLTRGVAGLRALEPNIALEALAAQARKLDEATRALLLTGDELARRAALESSEAGRALLAGVSDFIVQHGSLSANGTDFSLPTWREQPEVVWRAVGRMAAQPAAAHEDSRVLRQTATARVLSRLHGPRRWLFEQLLGSTLTFIDLREHVSAHISASAHELRRVFLTLADQFVSRGVIAQRDDIFHLTLDEARAAANAPDDLRAVVAARRAEMEEDAKLELPEVVRGSLANVRPVPAPSGHDALAGIAGSAGIVQGIARVVRDPADAPLTLTRGDILVVPFTDVGWTPLLTRIGGIVSETGGQLSHTAIVAREYGLPAVVSVKRATQLVRDGQPITVDGGLGRVYLETPA